MQKSSMSSQRAAGTTSQVRHFSLSTWITSSEPHCKWLVVSHFTEASLAEFYGTTGQSFGWLNYHLKQRHIAQTDEPRLRFTSSAFCNFLPISMRYELVLWAQKPRGFQGFHHFSCFGYPPMFGCFWILDSPQNEPKIIKDPRTMGFGGLPIALASHGRRSRGPPRRAVGPAGRNARRWRRFYQAGLVPWWRSSLVGKTAIFWWNHVEIIS